jgi:hypothetical protein
MKHTIYYKDLLGRQTKDVLRELNKDDENYVRRVMNAYKDLAQVDPRPEFGQWFDTPNPKLPKFKDRGRGHNSPRTWCDGILSKLSQVGRDLSPVQCSGIETLSSEIEEMYEENLCPSLEFKNKADKDLPKDTSFNTLFRR